MYVDDTFVIQKAEHGITVFKAHQLYWPRHSIHPGDYKHRWFHSFYGHISFTRTRQLLCLLQSTENLPTHASDTYTWTATTTYLLSIMCLILSHVGLEQFVTNTQLLHKEADQIWGALLRCKYPTWAFYRLLTKDNCISTAIHRPDNSSWDNNYNANSTNTNQNNNSNIHMVVPYTKDLSKSFKNICGKVGIQVDFLRRKYHQKPPSGAPNDKENITKKSRVIYRYK